MLFKYINLRVSSEIERDTEDNRLNFTEVKPRSKTQELHAKRELRTNKVLDEGQALVNKQDQLKSDKMMKSRQALEELLFRIPQLSAVDPAYTDYPPSDDLPMNLQLVTLQVCLSKILTEMMSMRAANLLFGDVCSLSKSGSVLQL